MSEAAGAKVDGTLTRASQRVRDQQRRHEGDMLPAHVFDHNKRTLKPNPDFLTRYPGRIAETFSQAEMETAGHSKIAKVYKDHKAAKAAHQKEANSGITYRSKPRPGQSPPVQLAP